MIENAGNTSRLRGCPDCGNFVTLPEAAAGMLVQCPRCLKILQNVRKHSYHYLLACVVTGFVFCLLLATAPLIHVMLYGRLQSSTLWTGPETLGKQDFPMLATIILLTTLCMPLAKQGLAGVVLMAAYAAKPPSWTARLFRLMKIASAWAMLEVYLLGFMVAYTRLNGLVIVQIDIAVYALIGAIIVSAIADSGIDSEEIWEKIKIRKLPSATTGDKGTLLACHLCFKGNYAAATGSRCTRCGARLYPRRKNSLERSWAFMIAALLFYIPANYFPVMTITQMGKTASHTIIGGMFEFIRAGFIPIALLIFVASILIPLLKLVSLFYMLVVTHQQSAGRMMTRMRLYRIIHFIGRWSMVDIFMVSIMVSLVQFGQIAEITSGIGAICFAAVVILTILAVENFDTRLMWDTLPPEQQEVPTL